MCRAVTCLSLIGLVCGPRIVNRIHTQISLLDRRNESVPNFSSLIVYRKKITTPQDAPNVPRESPIFRDYKLPLERLASLHYSSF